jgi:ATP-dependent RNA helicase MSS116, mitochondrial
MRLTRSLRMGFRDDIEVVIKYLPPPPARQTFMFSTTLSKPIQQTAREALSRKQHFIDVHSPIHAHVPQYQTIVEASQQIP